MKSILESYEKEFFFLVDHFEHFELLATVDIKGRVPTAGVYIILEGEKVFKVGRHFVDVVKRSKEHFRDNTGKISEKVDLSKCKIAYFTVKKPTELHWVAALEIFFELTLNPEIRSKRLG